jgi:hypothetical protein
MADEHSVDAENEKTSMRVRQQRHALNGEWDEKRKGWDTSGTDDG